MSALIDGGVVKVSLDFDGHAHVSVGLNDGEQTVEIASVQAFGKDQVGDLTPEERQRIHDATMAMFAQEKRL